MSVQPAQSAHDVRSGEAAGVSVADAARRIGVATSTLRTWERRYGLRPSGRTTGGHRRYTADDVAALQRLRQLIDTGMPTASAAAMAGEADRTRRLRTTSRASTDDDEVRRFAVAVEQFDSREAAAAATAIIDKIGVIAAWTEVFTPHLQAAGEHWESTGEGVEREHLGASAIRTALTRHTQRRAPTSGGPRLLAAATPSEAHALPLDALAAALADHGVGSVVLEMLPPVALHAAVGHLNPQVLVLWARSPDTRDDALVRSLVTRVPLVCAAGPGWQVQRLPRSVVGLDDLPSAVDAVRAWTR